MKIPRLFIIFLIVLMSCNNDSGSVDNSDLQNSEYVMLIPEGFPISTVELDNNIQIIYLQSEVVSFDTYKISQVNSDGIIEWTKEIESINGYIYKAILKRLDSDLYFIYLQNDGLKFIQFDFNGNILKRGIISNIFYNDLQESNDGFFAIKYERNIIITNKHTFAGDLIKSSKITTDIHSINHCKVLIKNGFSYVLSKENFTGNDPFFYQNLNCKIFNSSSEMTDEFDIVLDNKIGIEQLSLALNSGNILTINYNGETNKTHIEIFDSEGSLMFNNSFEEPTAGSSFITEDNTGSLRFIIKNNVATGNTKNMRLITLTQNLEVISERSLGSISDIGDNARQIIENENFIYVIGSTAGTDGDFDLPNNSTSDDLFIFKLKK